MRYFSIIIILFLEGCNLFTSNNFEQVDLRNLNWSADTLWHKGELQILMKNIYGTGIDNILIAGHAAGSDFSIYSYEGGKIKVEPFQDTNGGSITGYFDADNIFLFSKKDKWACGAGPDKTNRVIRFNGDVWEDVPFDKTYYSYFGLTSIWGVSANDVWFSGYEGDLFHWDGDLIHRDSIPDPYIADPQQFFNHTDLTGDQFGNVYFLMRTMDSSGSNKIYYLYMRDNNQWKRLNSWPEDFMSMVNIWCDPSGALYGIGAGGIRKFNFDTGDWEWFAYFVGHSYYAMYGTSDDNLLLTSSHHVLHFNGIDWQEISDLRNENVNYLGVWTDGKEAFVVAQYGWKSIIYHGK